MVSKVNEIMNKMQLTKKQQKLIVDNYKLLSGFINKIIRDKGVPEYLEDEFISDMFFKFCLSALRFDELSGFKFSTYAYGGFKFGLHELLYHKQKKIKKICYFEEDDLEYLNSCKSEQVSELEIDF